MAIYKTEQNINDEVIIMNIEMDEVEKSSDIYRDTRGIDDLSRKVLKSTGNLLSDGIDLARGCAACAVEGIKKMDDTIRPNEFEMQFAVKLDAGMGAVLTNMGAEAQLQITMKWTS